MHLLNQTHPNHKTILVIQKRPFSTITFYKLQMTLKFVKAIPHCMGSCVTMSTLMIQWFVFPHIFLGDVVQEGHQSIPDKRAVSGNLCSDLSLFGLSISFQCINQQLLRVCDRPTFVISSNIIIHYYLCYCLCCPSPHLMFSRIVLIKQINLRVVHLPHGVL